jgi:hypothetical protein
MSEDIRSISEFERRLRNAGVNMNGMVFQSLEGVHSAVLGILTDAGNDPGAPNPLQGLLDASEDTARGLAQEVEKLKEQLASIEAAKEPIALPPQDPLPVPEATGPSTPTSETPPPSPEPVADPTQPV